MDAALAELAAVAGIDLEYWTLAGERRVASEDALCRVLVAMGHACERPGDAGAALAAERERLWSALAEPTVTHFADEARGPLVSLRLLAGQGGEVDLELTLDSGERRRFARAVGELPITARVTLGSGEQVERELELPRLPPGYHELVVTLGARRAEVFVMAAPATAAAPPGQLRGFGLFAPLYGLRGAGAVADLGDLGALARLTARAGGRVVGTLPLLAGFFAEPFQPSPYSPVSRRFWNELYVDSRALAHDLAAPAPAAAPAAELAALAGEPLVDYRRAMALQRRALEPLAAHAFARPAIRAELEAAVADQSALADYADFRAATEHYRRPWGEWPAAARDGALGAGDLDPAHHRYHVFAQWAMERQLAALRAAAERGAAAGLYLDLPVGSDGRGYDRWRERTLFAPAMAIGAPPDPLAWAGQNWALPPLLPAALAAQRYRYVIDCIRTHMAHARLLRVDHVIGLHRLFWIPDGLSAADGVYVRSPTRELYAILLLESHRAGCAVAGEDLGTVPDAVRPTMAERGLHRLFVAQFDWRRDGGWSGPNPAPAGAIASLGTHDTETFASFVAREQLGDGGDRLAEWTAAMGDGDADLVMVTLEDLWLERAPQNVPGTTDEQPNWRRKLALTLDEAVAQPSFERVVGGLARSRKSLRPGSGSDAA